MRITSPEAYLCTCKNLDSCEHVFQISGRRTDYSLTIMMLSDTSTEKVIPSCPGIPAKIAWPESQNKEISDIPKWRDSLQNNNNNNKNQGQEREKEN